MNTEPNRFTEVPVMLFQGNWAIEQYQWDHMAENGALTNRDVKRGWKATHILHTELVQAYSRFANELVWSIKRTWLEEIAK